MSVQPKNYTDIFLFYIKQKNKFNFEIIFYAIINPFFILFLN